LPRGGRGVHQEGASSRRKFSRHEGREKKKHVKKRERQVVVVHPREGRVGLFAVEKEMLNKNGPLIAKKRKATFSIFFGGGEKVSSPGTEIRGTRVHTGAA